MKPMPEEFAAAYASLSELDLLRLAGQYDTLTDPAQAALRAEFAKRGLEPPLVDGPTDQLDSQTLVTIERYRDHSEAIVARSLLESANIPVYLADENFVRLDWQMSQLVGGIRLQVAPADEAAALELLRQPAPDPIDFAAGQSFAQPHCPVCTSTDIAFQGQSRDVALPTLFLIGIPVPLGAETWLCNHCGARWEDSAAENPPPTSNFGA